MFPRYMLVGYPVYALSLVSYATCGSAIGNGNLIWKFDFPNQSEAVCWNPAYRIHSRIRRRDQRIDLETKHKVTLGLL